MEDRLSTFVSSLLCIVLLTVAVSCATPQEKAQKELRKKGIVFDRDSFLQKVKKDDREAVQLLMEAGIPAETGLLMAARRGNCDMLKFLLSHGASGSSWKAAEALGAALQYQHSECVKLLKQAGADLNFRNELQETIAIKAAEKNDVALLEVLLKNDVALEMRSGFGETALIVAAKKGNIEAVRVLLQSGANVDSTDRDGWTSLLFAAYLGKTEVVRDLLAANANANQTSDLGWTALHHAVQNGHREIVRILIEKGADVDFYSKAASDAVTIAIKNQRHEILQDLLAAGAASHSGPDGNDPAVWARVKNDRAILDILSESGWGAQR